MVLTQEQIEEIKTRYAAHGTINDLYKKIKVQQIAQMRADIKRLLNALEESEIDWIAMKETVGEVEAERDSLAAELEKAYIECDKWRGECAIAQEYYEQWKTHAEVAEAKVAALYKALLECFSSPCDTCKYEIYGESCKKECDYDFSGWEFDQERFK